MTLPDKKSAKPAWAGGTENIAANMCTNYNYGTCTHNHVGTCPVRHNLLHACSKCGGKHAWGDSPQPSKPDKTGLGFNLKMGSLSGS